jgi:hypothetical protein
VGPVVVTVSGSAGKLVNTTQYNALDLYSGGAWFDISTGTPVMLIQICSRFSSVSTRKFQDIPSILPRPFSFKQFLKITSKSS